VIVRPQLGQQAPQATLSHSILAGLGGTYRAQAHSAGQRQRVKTVAIRTAAGTLSWFV